MNLIACPACQSELHLPSGMAGQKVRCPSCAQVFQAPPFSVPEPRSAAELGRRSTFAPDDESAEEMRSQAYEEDEEDERRSRRPKGPPGIALAACILLLLSVVVIMVGGLEGVYTAILAATENRADAYVFAILGLLLRFVFAGLLTWGVVEFRRFGLLGGAITATVFVFIEAFLFLVYAVVIGFLLTVNRQNVAMNLRGIIMLEIAYSVFGCVVHSITGIVCVMALSNSQVKKAFRRGSQASRYE